MKKKNDFVEFSMSPKPLIYSNRTRSDNLDVGLDGNSSFQWKICGEYAMPDAVIMAVK